jgi:hypothetical protein
VSEADEERELILVLRSLDSLRSNKPLWQRAHAAMMVAYQQTLDDWRAESSPAPAIPAPFPHDAERQPAPAPRRKPQRRR